MGQADQRDLMMDQGDLNSKDLLRDLKPLSLAAQPSRSSGHERSSATNGVAAAATEASEPLLGGMSGSPPAGAGAAVEADGLVVVVGCTASREDVPAAIGRCFTHKIQVWREWRVCTRDRARCDRIY